MIYLKNVIFNEHGLYIDYIDKHKIIIGGVEAKIDDDCLMIGNSNMVINKKLTKIVNIHISSNYGETFDVYFENIQYNVEKGQLFPIKLFGVYE